jgi:alkylation response protein AidB-like acyl-CoA dehydrogenase
MPRLGPAEQAIVDTVARFVERDVKPVARDLEAADAYPEPLIERMKQLGVYGLLVPERFGGVGVSTACFALVTEELARGWMSLAGAMGGHSVVTYLIHTYGTPSQRSRYLPLPAVDAHRGGA